MVTKKKPKRSTSEKPISMMPLTLDEALADLLQTAPPPKEKARKARPKAKTREKGKRA